MNVEKGKTAIHRKKISPPVKYISKFMSGVVLDYGAGYGKNAEELRDLGFCVYAYDPYNYKEDKICGFKSVSNILPTFIKFDFSFTSYVLNVVDIKTENEIVNFLYDYTESGIYHICRNKELIDYSIKRTTKTNAKDILVEILNGINTSRGFQRLVILPEYDLLKNTYSYKIYKRAKYSFNNNSLEKILSSKEAEHYLNYIKNKI